MLVRNPQAPRGLFDGIAFDGSMAGAYRGSTYYHDSSGHDNTGTLTNMDPATDWVWSPELNRWALDFDGSDDYVSGPAWGQQNTALTYAAWIRPAVVTSGWLMGTGNSGTFSSGQIAFHSSGLLYFRNAGSGGIYYNQTVLATGAWRHIAAVRESDTGPLTWYLDGVFDRYWSSVTATQSQAGQRFCIARFGDATAGPYYSGLMADVMVYHDRGLTPPEIQWLASPANHLRVPWRRTVWPVVSAGPTFNPAWAARCNNLIGAGI